jgi:hypothetical protein
MIEIHEDEIRELLVHYKFKEREVKNLRYDIQIQEQMIKSLRNNNERLRKNNLDLIAQIEGEMTDLAIFKSVLQSILEVKKDTVENMRLDNLEIHDFIYTEIETFEKVIKLADAQMQRFQKEKLTEL